MAKNLFLFPKKDSKTISSLNVLKEDVIPWLVSILSVCILNVLIVILIKSSATNDIDFTTASAYLYQQGVPIYALAIVGCLIARQRKDKWTWILAAIIILFNNNNMTVTTLIFPNSALPMMTTMLGLLALGRIAEYVRMRYIIKLTEPIMSKGAWFMYILLTAGSVLANSTLLTPLLP